MDSYHRLHQFAAVLSQFILLLGMVSSNPANALAPYKPPVVDPLQEPWRWRHVKSLDGAGVLTMIQARDGNLWFGTARGVMRYDGRHWTKFGKKDGLLNLYSKALLSTRDGAIYARSKRAVAKYSNGKWQRLSAQWQSGKYPELLESSDGSVWTLKANGVVQIKGEEVTFHLEDKSFEDLVIDKKQNLWLVSSGTGDLYRYPMANGRLKSNAGIHIRNTKSALKKAGGKAAQDYDIAVTDECVWVLGIDAGSNVRCYDLKQKRWRDYWLDRLGGANVHYGMLVDSDNAVWVYGRFALHIYKQGQWRVYTAPEFDIPGALYDVAQFADGSIWLGGQFTGVRRIAYGSQQREISYKGLHYQCEMPAGTRWFLDSSSNIVLHHTKKDEWQVFEASDNVIDNPVAIIASKDGTVWAAGNHSSSAAVAYYYGGLWQRDLHPTLSRSIAHSSPVELRDGSIMFGTTKPFTENLTVPQTGGMVIYSKVGDEYEYEYITPPSVPEKLTAAAQTSDGLIWIVTVREFYVLDINNISAPNSIRKVVTPKEFGEGRSTHIAVTHDDNIWISNQRKGVFRYDGSNWRRYTTKDGLLSDLTYYLQSLSDGTLVVATKEGFSRFDGRSWTPVSLEAMARIIEPTKISESNDGGLWLNISGRTWLTGVGPMSDVDLNTIKSIYYPFDNKPPDTYIEAYNRRLPHNGYNNVFWSGTDAWTFTNEQQLHYSYRLNNGDWSEYKPQQRHLFGDLTHGKYTLEVRARDNDFNVDPTPAAVQFHVIPPLWSQIWFQLLALVAISVISILVILIMRIREKHLVEIDEMKMNFITNVSHELRAPLTLILGPLEGLLDSNENSKQRKLLLLMQRNANRLMNLVNQLLDFRKLEMGKFKAEITESDIVTYTKDILDTLRPMANEKAIQYQIDVPEKLCMAWIDPDKYEKILNNLVVNAIKYTPKGGKVSVKLTIEKQSAGDHAMDNAILTIEDSGLGIDKKYIKNIFDPFYRGDNVGEQIDGSGIGLALTKQMVTLCGGTIEVVSPINRSDEKSAFKGTRFTVRLPTNKYDLSEKAHAVEREEVVRNESEPVKLEITQAPGSSFEEEQGQPPLVLLVDDEEDICQFIQDNMGDDYRFCTAENGEVGLEQARKILPDLVITDVMMPVMNGIELCEKLKTDEVTSHIPVILLTARSSKENELAGLDTGADDYVKKPFHMALLKARVANILNSRRRLRNRFIKEGLLHPGKIATAPADREFLQRAVQVVENHMSDSDFNVEDFVDEMRMTHKALYAKLKSLTNQSVQSFIRIVRLEHSMRLLKSSGLPVSEIAGKVGFSDRSYFSRCFKQHFGVSPTDADRVN